MPLKLRLRSEVPANVDRHHVPKGQKLVAKMPRDVQRITEADLDGPQ